MTPVPESVLTIISLGRRTKENLYGKKLWFYIVRKTFAAFWLNNVPKSNYGGSKVTALTVNEQSKLNLTDKTWLVPVSLTGMRIKNSS